MAKGPAAPKKTPPAAAAPKAQASAPDTPPESSSAPAPDTAQNQAGAGETQAFNGLRITSAREGFCRAGRAWSKQPTEIPMEGLTDDEIKALKDEPMLTVEEVTLP